MRTHPQPLPELYPPFRPDVDFNFAATRSLDPRITFSRASSATLINAAGLVETAGTNVPRFTHDPVTGQSLGLLVEEARTNIVVRSEFLNWSGSPAAPVGWSVATPVVWSAEIGLSNTLTAARIQGAASNPAGALGANAAISFVLGTVYTVSAWFKRNSTSTGAVFVAVDGTGSNAVIFPTSTMPVGQWVRLGGSFTANSSTFGGFRFHTNNVVLDVTIDKVQIEAGSFATSYIPTTGASALRAADLATITGTNFASWYRQDEGTIAIDFVATALQNTSVETAAYFDDGAAGTANRIWVSKRDGAPFAMRALVSSGGVTSADLNFAASPLSANARTRLAFAFAVNNFNGSQNGLGVVTDSSGAIPAPVIARLAIGNRNGANQLNGPIARIRYYRRRLPDAMLQRLTAL